MSNRQVTLPRRLHSFGLCFVLLVAALFATSCIHIFKQEKFTPGPAVAGSKQGGAEAEEQKPAAEKASGERAEQANIPPRVVASTSTVATKAVSEVEIEDKSAEPEKEAETGDKVLFSAESRAPRGKQPESLKERETWPYLTLESAPIEQVLEMFIKIMPERGTFNYIVDPSVKSKKITTRFWRPVNPDNLWFILQSILTMNGLAMVDSGRDFYKIVPLPNAKQLPLKTYVGHTGNRLQLADTLMTQVIPTEHILPSALLKLIKPFLSNNAYEVTNDDTMLLIITDLESNIKRVMAFVKLLDVPMATEKLKVYPIQYADAGEVASILDKLFSAKKSSASPAMSRRSRRRPRSSGTASRTSGISGALGAKPVIITDKRSNSLIVLGRKAALKAVEQIISMLDVDVYGAEKTYVYYLENAEAKSMASLLSSLYSKGRRKSTGSRARSSKRRSPFESKVRERGSAGTKPGSKTGSVVGDVNIVADEFTNSLIIVTDPVNYPEIERTIKALDIRPKQVLIEVLIAELTLDKTTQFGLEWALKGQGSATIGGEKFNVVSDIAQALNVPSGSGFVLSVVDASRLKSLLNAYASQSKLHVLSTPRIIASNNQEAKIYVGKDVPIVTSETSSSSTSVSSFDTRRTIQYKDTGIILDVTPHVNEKKTIKLEINQTVSDAQTNKIGGSDSPIVNRREIKTTVFMNDRDTLLIGGLIKKNVNTAKEGIPLLMDIPWAGKLFSSTSVIETNTELLILITPTIVETMAETKAAICDYERSMKDLFNEIRKRKSAIWEREPAEDEQTGKSESDGKTKSKDTGKKGSSGKYPPQKSKD